MFYRYKKLIFALNILATIIIQLILTVKINLAQAEQILEGHYYVAENPLPFIEIEQEGLAGKYPDWSKISFSRLEGKQESGELISQPSWDRAIGYSLSRFWQEGDSPAIFLKLGDFTDSIADNLTINYILKKTMTELEAKDVPLSAFALVRKQTIASLVEAVPKLKNLKVKEVEPIFDLLGGKYRNYSIGNIATSALGDIRFDEISLNDYSLDDIPYLSDIPITDFKDWQNAFVDEVPGLWDLPFSEIFGREIFSAGLLAMADIAFGTAEGDIDNTISGSYQEGFSVPCSKDCAHVELAPWASGKRWISGKYQKVKGGKGILGLINKGLEPTGRHPFGKAFKVVVQNVSEKEGKIEMALYLHYCRKTLFVDLGCTPYFLGPIHFLTYHEKDLMFLGTLDGEGRGVSPGNTPVFSPPTPIPSEENSTPSQETGGLINPLPGAPVTSEYGYRIRPRTGASTFHSGIDLAFRWGDSRFPGRAIASASGKVVGAGWVGNCGNWVKVQHSSGLATGYCHLNQIYVKKGQDVTQGQAVGEVGTTGISTGVHLHFIVYQGVKQVNPRKYVAF